MKNTKKPKRAVNRCPDFKSLTEHCIKDIKDFDFVLNNKAWKVRFIGADSELLEYIDGVCDVHECIIGISTTIDNKNVINTLFHELEHAIISTLAKGQDTLNEEQVAEANGIAWPLVLAQLPIWVKKECDKIFEDFSKVLRNKKQRKS